MEKVVIYREEVERGLVSVFFLGAKSLREEG